MVCIQFTAGTGETPPGTGSNLLLYLGLAGLALGAVLFSKKNKKGE